MVVALAILVLVSLSLFAFARSVTASWQRLHREQQAFSRLLALDRALDRMLSNAVPFRWRDEDREPVPFFRGGPTRCRLAVAHPVHREEDGGLRFVELFLEDGRLMARYSQRPFLAWEPVPGLSGESVLAADVDEVQLAYADWSDDTGREWEDRLEWAQEWDDEREDLPLAIWLTVVWRDGKTESWLRRTQGAGWRERYGSWSPADEGRGGG